MSHPLARTLLVIGNLLALLAIGVPWLLLSTSFNISDSLNWFSPWAAIVQSVLTRSFSMLAVAGALYFLLAFALLRVSFEYWPKPSGRAIPRTPFVVIIMLAVFTLGFVGFMLGVAPFGLELGYPYFHVAVGPGGFMAIAGAICVAAGIGIISASVNLQRTVPPAPER